DVQQRAFWRNLASKAKQIANERLRSASLIANLRRGSTGFLWQIRIVGEQVRITQDCGQGIVDFVCGASGKLPERNEFFRLNELRLQALQIPDRLFGFGEKERSVFIRNMRSQEDDEGERHRGDQRGHQAIVADFSDL